jgi:PAS domain-containing protein
MIEQFAAQAPFAVWITDSRGVAIFANKKLHDILAIPMHPSGALGANLFTDPVIEQLNLSEASKRLQAGETVDQVVEIERPELIETTFGATREDPMTLRILAYALMSSAQHIEHYVVIIEDLTENRKHQKRLREQLRNVGVYASTKVARLKKMEELSKEVEDLEREIRALGADPK